MFQTSCRGN